MINYVESEHSDKNKELKRLEEKLQALKQNTQTVKSDLDALVEKKANEAANRFKDHLAENQDLNIWKEEETPNAENTNELSVRVSDAVKNRLVKTIKAWNKENQFLKDIKAKLYTNFKDKFLFLDKDLKGLEITLIDSDTVLEINKNKQDSRPVIFKLMENTTLQEKLLLGISAPIWIPWAVIGGILALPAYGFITLVDKYSETKILKTYNQDKPAYLKKITDTFISNLCDDTYDNNSLKDIFLKEFKQIYLMWEKLIDRIPLIIKADEVLMNDMKKDKQAIRNALGTYHQQLKKCEAFLNKLYLYEACCLKKYQFKESDLNEMEKDSTRKHSFGNVFYIEKVPGLNKPAMVNISSQVLMKENVISILKYSDNLRKFDHPNILKLYGSALFKSLNLALVLEYWKFSLSQYIYDNFKVIPGKQKINSNARETFQTIRKISIGILKGILYLQEMNCVHQNLNPNNILLQEITGDFLPKISDIGLIKLEDEMNRKLEPGDRLYMAPEVKEGEVQVSSDMYSYGLIMWELWYGEKIFSKKESIFEDKPKTDIPLCSPRTWQMLMNQCWAQSSERPQPNQAIETIKNIIM